jgi:hypothetical protein
MVKWLEMITQGQPSRILINEEGSHIGISAYPVSDSHTRIVMHRYWGDLTVPIDHVIKTKTFVNSLYAEMLRFISDKSLLYRMWAWDWKEEFKKYPSLDSQAIEEYLMGMDEQEE